MKHPTSILLLVILGFLASFVEYSQAVPVASDPYHEEKLGRVKIQVYRGPNQQIKESQYNEHHHGGYHDTYAAHGFFVKQPLNIGHHKHGYDHHH